MQAAYLILAHDRPDLAARLAGALDGPAWLHVDCRVDAAPFAAAGTIVKDRVAPLWGSFGILEATLNGMRAASEEPFDRLMLLSGRDYPIKPSSVIAREMAGSTSVIDHHRFPHPDWKGGGWKRVTRWNDPAGPDRQAVRRAAGNALAVARTAVRGRRTPPQHPYGGSAWWCLTREAVDYVLGYCDANPEDLDFWRHVEFPDEIFFQTVLAGSGLPLENRAPTLMAWGRRGGVVHDDDVPGMVASPQWFGRKFDSESTMDLVDASIADYN